jgi:hypothetical protein
VERDGRFCGGNEPKESTLRDAGCWPALSMVELARIDIDQRSLTPFTQKRNVTLLTDLT